MTTKRVRSIVLLALSAALLAGCGTMNNLFGRVGPAAVVEDGTEPVEERGREAFRSDGATIWDVFRPRNQDTVVKVNRYLWNASLDVLSFLPIRSVDPFTGVIVTGYGTPPGGGRAYRATVYITDPALEARSLNVALQTTSGPVAESTQRAVEDAILTRARQMRVEAARF